MIPEQYIEQWRQKVGWQTPTQVEQDLVISRTLVCLYTDPHIKEALVFRGGTALNKLFITPAVRYSEDIDFVQKRAEPIGKTLDRIRGSLHHWLGNPTWTISPRSVRLIYKFKGCEGQVTKLKIEINTTEHFQILPLKHTAFSVEYDWFSGSCEIATYEPNELMATKLRALYQRRKGRDLFDLWYVYKYGLVDGAQVIAIFQKYCEKDGIQISKKLFRDNLELKKSVNQFQLDMKILLPNETEWNFNEAFDFVQQHILSKLPD